MTQQHEWSDRIKNTPWKDIYFEWHPLLPSTQDRAHELLDHQYARGSLVVADEQSSGRGRNGRVWLSRKQSGLYMSMTWQWKNRNEWIHALPLVVACSCVEAIKALPEHQLKVHVKWPNDIYVNTRKIGGILIDTRMNNNENEMQAVIGIGVTLGTSIDAFPEEWRDRVTSWDQEEVQVPTQARLGAAIYTSLRMALERFETISKDQIHLIKSWFEDYIIWNDIRLPYRVGEQIVYGKAKALNEQMQLRIVTDANEDIWLRN